MAALNIKVVPEPDSTTHFHCSFDSKAAMRVPSTPKLNEEEIAWRQSAKDVSRVASDFQWLHKDLAARYCERYVIPPLTESHALVVPASGSATAMQKKAEAYCVFLQRVAAHPEMCNDESFKSFLCTPDNEFAVVRKTSAEPVSTLKGRGVISRLVAKKRPETLEEATLSVVQGRLSSFQAESKKLTIVMQDLARAQVQVQKQYFILEEQLGRMAHVEPEMAKMLNAAAVASKAYGASLGTLSDATTDSSAHTVASYQVLSGAVIDLVKHRSMTLEVLGDVEEEHVKTLEDKALAAEKEAASKGGFMSKVTKTFTTGAAELEERAQKEEAQIAEIKAQLDNNMGPLVEELTRFESWKLRDYKQTYCSALRARVDHHKANMELWSGALTAAEAAIADASEVNKHQVWWRVDTIIAADPVRAAPIPDKAIETGAAPVHKKSPSRPVPAHGTNTNKGETPPAKAPKPAADAGVVPAPAAAAAAAPVPAGAAVPAGAPAPVAAGADEATPPPTAPKPTTKAAAVSAGEVDKNDVEKAEK